MQGTALRLFRARTTLIALFLVCWSLPMKPQTQAPNPSVATAAPVPAQDAPKSIALTDKSDVPVKDILKALQKGCPNVSITNDATKGDFTLEAIKKTVSVPGEGTGESFDLTLFTHDGKTFRSTSTGRLGSAVKDVCHAINRAVIVEVVDTQNLTQSMDLRGVDTGSALGNLLADTTGRRTHTDTSTLAVTINGEHAVLDCFERRKGCITVGPGKYYGELDFGSIHGVQYSASNRGGGGNGGIWIQFEMPVTHKPVRVHYAIAGSW